MRAPRPTGPSRRGSARSAAGGHDALVAIPVASDGRRLRGAQSRARVADALLALLREGRTRPSADEVAARASVARRTLFNQFSSLGDLFGELHERQLNDVRAAMPPLPTRGSLPQRVARYMTAYVAVLEMVAPVRLAGLSFDGAPRERLQLRRRMNKVQAVLSAGPLELLSQADAVLPARLLPAFKALLDPLTYQGLRVQQGLSRPRARQALIEGVLALAAPKGRTR